MGGRGIARRAPLERPQPRRLLCAVRRDWVADGIKSGLIAAGATAGALSGLGLRLGTGSRPFWTIGAVVLGGGRAARWAFGAVVVGIVVHAAVATAWGVIHALLVERAGRLPWIWAFAIGIASLLFSGAVARLTGTGVATVLSLPGRIEVALVLVVALRLGMGFAKPGHQTDPHRWNTA
jgi:hypothetical protein